MSLMLATAVIALVSVSACTTDADTEETSTLPPAPFTSPTDVDTWSFPVPSRPTTPTAPTALPDGITVDRSSADSVALAAATVWFSWDTTTDTSPYAAALRATPLMGPKCRAQTLASAPQGSPGADWTALARVHAKARV
ncbi:MAG: hypothetical protein LBE07_00610, partial [Gordonia sp. (in: high G+C Gram-positive bacteria)]|nr:hypothetical protein [Gordonia sp. (in: high G+C Gram-positive bacteria)]